MTVVCVLCGQLQCASLCDKLVAVCVLCDKLQCVFLCDKLQCVFLCDKLQCVSCVTSCSVRPV